MSRHAQRLNHASTHRDAASMRKAGHFLAGALMALVLSACGTDRFAQRPPAWSDTLHDASRPMQIQKREGDTQTAPPPVGDDAANRVDPAFYKPGSGVMVRPASSIAQARPQPEGDVKLNFQNANLLEVIKVILGDMLETTYTVDPEVQGAVSMQTTGALHRDDLIPTLELLLRMNNAALVSDGSMYRVVTLAKALAEVRAPQLGDSTLSLPGGFRVQIVPLRFVAAEDMAQILTPFVTGGNQLLRVDTARNLLILAASGGDMDRLLETVKVFDVDRMTGMSVALFTPDYVDAGTLANDLEALLTDPQHGLMTGLVRFIVIERLNGLMVVTPRAEHLAQVRTWIRRLDRNTGDASPRLFVYRVQNGKATDLADVLSKLFNPEAATRQADVKLAPGLEPKTIGTTMSAAKQADGKPDDKPAIPRPVQAARPATVTSASASGLDVSQARSVQIIADEPNNALLILARGTEYRQILTALRQLDVSPMQVLIEVTIAEVTLADNLAFGVEWFFRNNIGSKSVGESLLDLGSGVGAVVPGFSYAIKGTAVDFVLNTLAEESNLSIISSPSLLVLNNKEATINVGEEVPVKTQESTSTANPDSPLVTTIDYRNTGVVLNVKPRVNAGGLVIMEVEQEVSQAPSTAGADALTPRITQRKIASTVAVNSGDTIILGGLIQENRDLSESGLPGLHKVPILGSLFGSKSDNQKRTELIVLITPRAISSSTAALQVTEEYRRRLRKLIPSKKVSTDAPE